MLLNHIMYMIMVCVLVHFYCMKYLMYMTFVITIVAGKHVLKSFKIFVFALDCNPTMNVHASAIAQTCYFEIRCLSSIRRQFCS